MTLSVHDLDTDKLLSKDIKEFQYVVKNDDRAMIAVSKSVKRALDIYKKHKGIRTLGETVWRACALGIRCYLLSDDPEIQAMR